MREIKFRAWDKKAKAMSPPFALFGEFTLLGAVHDWQHEVGKVAGIDQKPGSLDRLYKDLEVMQFSGLLDKNGKEIYEDDILSFEDKFTYRVVYHEAKFVCIHGTKSNAIKGLVWGPLHRFFDPDFLVYGGVEVIGNIFEDPDKL